MAKQRDREGASKRGSSAARLVADLVSRAGGPAGAPRFHTATTATKATDARNEGIDACGGGKRRRRSGGSLVGVVEAAEDGPHEDGSRVWAGHRLRRLQPERAVGPLGVVGADELGQHRAEVLLIQDDLVIKALAPEGADQPLGDGIRPRRTDGRPRRSGAR